MCENLDEQFHVPGSLLSINVIVYNILLPLSFFLTLHKATLALCNDRHPLGISPLRFYPGMT